jgi:hypothetical protein
MVTFQCFHLTGVLSWQGLSEMSALKVNPTDTELAPSVLRWEPILVYFRNDILRLFLTCGNLRVFVTQQSDGRIIMRGLPRLRTLAPSDMSPSPVKVRTEENAVIVVEKAFGTIWDFDSVPDTTNRCVDRFHHTDNPCMQQHAQSFGNEIV